MNAYYFHELSWVVRWIKKMNEGHHQYGDIRDSWISLLPEHTTSSTTFERNTDYLSDSYMSSAWENNKLKWVGMSSHKPTPSTVPNNQEGIFDLQPLPEEQGVWTTHGAPQLSCTDYFIGFACSALNLLLFILTCKIFLVTRTYP